MNTSAKSNVSLKRDYFINEVFIPKMSESASKKHEDTLLSAADGNEIPLMKEEQAQEESITLEMSKTFIDYYNDGITAYLSNDWESCINNMERSLAMYHEYYEVITTCRIRCENERKRYIPRHPEDFENRHFFESLVYKTLCLERCRTTSLPNMPKYFMFFDSDRIIFKTRKPYEYLQICYYRDKETEKAILAAYTVLIANPNDEIMKKNIKFYSKLDQFDFDKLHDLEDKRFSSFFQDAVTKYEQNEWNHAVELFEIAIDVWLQEWEKCRAFCEGEFNQGWLPDFTTAVSNHYAYTLRCKKNCTSELSYINGRYHEDLLPSMFDYLQYAYYKNNNVKDACQSASTYLLFYPKSETMLGNVEFYKTVPEVTDDYFTPRSEIKIFVHKNVYEQDLLRYIDDEFYRLLENEDRSEDKSSAENQNPTIDQTRIYKNATLTSPKSTFEMVMSQITLKGNEI